MLTHWTVFPLRKFYREQIFVLLRTKRMQLRNHANTQTVRICAPQREHCSRAKRWAIFFSQVVWLSHVQTCCSSCTRNWLYHPN